MKRLILIGLAVAMAALLYATLGDRIGLEGLLGRYGSGQRLPALRSQEIPIRYPAHLWRADVEGEVLLRVHITETGAVDSVELGQSSGHTVLDGIALEGAKLLEFYPAEKGEQAVAVWAELPIRFQKGSASAAPEEKER